MVVLLFALTLLVATFATATFTMQLDRDAAFLVGQGGKAPLALYVATFTTLLGWCFLDLLWAWLRLRHQVTGPLRTGLAFLAAGAVAGLTYVALRTVWTIAQLASWPSVATLTGRGCLITGTVAALLVATGISWHTLNTWRLRTQAWWLARRRFLALGPLWRDMVTAVPDIALQPPARWGAFTDPLKLTGLPWRVYRRVIEIHDASLALHRRAHAGGRGHAQPMMPGAHLETTVAQVREELDPGRPRHVTSDLRLYETLDQEAQIDRLVDIAEDHANRRTTITRPHASRDQNEDHV